ncbi:hypothetical protein C5473_12875 [Leptospira interrogans serovar Weerasinghe]|nr:hypothetical protein C5473_12875 [Leptospira interrogans serovar Weerasinghe]
MIKTNFLHQIHVNKILHISKKPEESFNENKSSLELLKNSIIGSTKLLQLSISMQQKRMENLFFNNSISYHDHKTTILYFLWDFIKVF